MCVGPSFRRQSSGSSPAGRPDSQMAAAQAHAAAICALRPGFVAHRAGTTRPLPFGRGKRLRAGPVPFQGSWLARSTCLSPPPTGPEFQQHLVDQPLEGFIPCRGVGEVPSKHRVHDLDERPPRPRRGLPHRGPGRRHAADATRVAVADSRCAIPHSACPRRQASPSGGAGPFHLNRRQPIGSGSAGGRRSAGGARDDAAHDQRPGPRPRHGLPCAGQPVPAPASAENRGPSTWPASLLATRPRIKTGWVTAALPGVMDRCRHACCLISTGRGWPP
jgi:hypothetical protein